MEASRAVASVLSSSAMVEKLAAGLESISCVYPNCQLSAPVELFNVHLARCRRNWRGPFTVCSYNSAHIVPAPEERYHETTCPDQWSRAEASGNKEKLDNVKKPAIRPRNDVAKKQGFDTSGVLKYRGRTSYFNRGGGRYSKWRNESPRLQNCYSTQSGTTSRGSGTMAGRSQRSSWRGSSVVVRGGRRPAGRGVAISSYRNAETKTASVDPSPADDLPASSISGFAPWASSKPRTWSLFRAARWNRTARTRRSAAALAADRT